MILYHGRSSQHPPNARYEHTPSHRSRYIISLVSKVHKVLSRLSGDAFVMTMANDRNMQMLHGEKIQILCCIPNEVPQNMRSEVIMRQESKLNITESNTKMTISNVVVSARLRWKLCLRKIQTRDVNPFHSTLH